MITTEQRSKVDKIWLDFHSNGVATTTDVIENFNYLIFLRQLDEQETRREKRARLTGETYVPKIFITEEEQNYRWHKLMDMSNTEERFKLFQEKVFPWLMTLNDDEKSAYARYMKDAKFRIPTALAFEKIMQDINELELNDEDSKGDLYEYMLSKMGSSGINGQFRTPRQIIKMMVAMANPQPTDIIVDPAMGTAGFLVAASEYMHAKFKESFYDEEFLRHYNHEMFNGFDNDTTMLGIGAMNMMLHSLESANITYKDSLGVSKDDDNTENVDEDKEKYTLVLANPPFKGTLDNAQVNPELLKITKSKHTELLFLAWFLRSLAVGGRAVVIVPAGVTFSTNRDYLQIRKAIIDDNRLEAVISMPSGIFQPYSGVATAILLFTKTGHGGTDKVWFYNMEADGLSLDVRRTEVEENDIPDILARWHNLDGEENRTRKEKSFFVPVEEIRQNNYDLTVNKYREIDYKPIEYKPAKEIMASVQEHYVRLGEIIADIQEKL
ncbi:class I SAM-dependent DNA methyltransferase [Selenomonas sp. AB3002]|uniref:class I SAM-dependent DNA methyltransferase n=1 Tax=Selenomonas sp. AB3002 TaxID=1392502 RepID=UPI0004960541